jgi:hypothetical protein
VVGAPTYDPYLPRRHSAMPTFRNPACPRAAPRRPFPLKPIPACSRGRQSPAIVRDRAGKLWFPTRASCLAGAVGSHSDTAASQLCRRGSVAGRGSISTAAGIVLGSGISITGPIRCYLRARSCRPGAPITGSGDGAKPRPSFVAAGIPSRCSCLRPDNRPSIAGQDGNNAGLRGPQVRITVARPRPRRDRPGRAGGAFRPRRPEPRVPGERARLRAPRPSDAGRVYAFDADGGLLRLASEAYRIRLAYLFDPYLAVSASQIEASPHQITTVYGEMLPRQPLRFLLADDPGAGKILRDC